MPFPTKTRAQGHPSCSCTIVGESAAECYLAPEDMKVGLGLSVTPLMGLMGNLRCLASGWSVPMDQSGRVYESVQ